MKINNIEFWDNMGMTEGGMKISWQDPEYGWGEITFYRKQNKLYADTEYMGRDFMEQVLKELSNYTVIAD